MNPLLTNVIIYSPIVMHIPEMLRMIFRAINEINAHPLESLISSYGIIPVKI